MNNEMSNSRNKDLNAFLSTEEGAKTGAKILPMLMSASIGQIEDSISQMAQQTILLTDSIEQNHNMTNSHAQEITQIKQAVEAIQAALGIAGIKTKPQEAMGAVSPTPTAQPQGDFANLSQFLNQAKSFGNSENNK